MSDPSSLLSFSESCTVVSYSVPFLVSVVSSIFIDSFPPQIKRISFEHNSFFGAVGNKKCGVGGLFLPLARPNFQRLNGWKSTLHIHTHDSLKLVQSNATDKKLGNKISNHLSENMSKPPPTEDPSTADVADTLLSDEKKQEMAAAFAAAMTNMTDHLNKDTGNDDAENAADVAAVSSRPLTYANTKESPFVLKAKNLMKLGDFEAALEKIESGITTIMSLLPESEDGNELHEAIAPLHYLYGTTLLYSVEESQESAEASVMTQQGMGGGGPDAAGDLQIAWENLESARSTLTKMNATDGNASVKEEKEDRDLDLAQIHFRLGDLSRYDGHYQKAIEDYEACCRGRREVLTSKGEDKIWDRRIADVEFYLGMTNMLLAAEGEKQLLDKEGENDKKSKVNNNAAASALAAAAGIDPNGDNDEGAEKLNLSPEEINALRERSLCHYVQCARILAGIIGSMTDKDPSELAAADESLEALCNIEEGDKKCAAKGLESGKTTGLEETTESSVQTKSSKALSTIRDRVSDLKPSDASDLDTVNDLREMLDEIQETIDNCETDREGLRDVNIMRKKAEEDAKKEDAMDTSIAQDEDGGTTSIGFGSASVASSTPASASAGFGVAPISSTSSKPAASAIPMMVVKKKKKKAATLEQVSAKKAKTSE